MRYVIEHFNSIDAMVEAGNKRPNNSAMGDSKDSETGSKSFTNTNSYKEAEELLKYGWSEKLPEIKKALGQFERVNAGTASVSRQRPALGIAGFTPHIPNAILGLPNSMIYTNKEPQKVKVIRILYGQHAHAGVKANDLTKAGIEVLKIVNRLESNGYRVQLDIIPYTGTGERQTAICNCTIKEYRQPLDLKKIAFPIAHPSMLRRIMFKWLETTPNLTDVDFRWGYGSPMRDYDDLKDTLKKQKVMDDNTFLITYYMVDDCGYDMDRICKKAGISKVIEGRAIA